MQIKVCGITNNRNLRDIAQLKPDYMGFIFHKSSPRDVTKIIDQLPLAAIPSTIKKVAVVVDQPPNMVRNLIKKYGFEAVQLHGDESPKYCRELMEECQVIKAFRLENNLPPQLDNYTGNCNMFLFDAKGKFPGGNGIKFNHDILKRYKGKTPFILSGGIGDNDLSYIQAINIVGLAGVDLNSRFELSPGYKCLSSLRVFIQKIKSNATVNKQ